MSYEKRVCVLKQLKKGFSADGGTLSGAVYAERLGSALTITPRILGIAPVREGRYALAVWAEGKTFVLELRGGEALHVADSPSVKGGFAALLVFLKGDPEPIAYGSCGLAPPEYGVLLDAMTRTAKKKSEAPMHQKEAMEEPAPSFRAPNAGGYDDEAIARSDYYQHAPDEDGDAVPASAGEAEEDAHGADARADAEPPYLDPRGSLTYYRANRERLEEAFRKFPKDERLKAVFPYSEWVRAEGALLGVIYGHGVPQFLCVAVEAHGDPPEEMREHASFVPASHFTEEEGFWVVFQSADSGEYVSVKES